MRKRQSSRPWKDVRDFTERVWQKAHSRQAQSGSREFRSPRAVSGKVICCNNLQFNRRSVLGPPSLRRGSCRCNGWQWSQFLQTVILMNRKANMAQAFPRLLQLLAFLLVIEVMPALAKEHPVPLDKNVDSAKCLECHEDKTKGKAVHSAIATGCLSCHEVRVNKDITRIKLITSTPQALCLSCHAEKDAAALKGTVHPPAVRDCIKCHDPHTSDNKNQLLKAESGDKGQNLCLDCHNKDLNVPEKGSRHAALDMGCDTCHTTHKTGRSGEAGVRLSSDQGASGALHRLPRCQRPRICRRRTTISRSRPRTAPVPRSAPVRRPKLMRQFRIPHSRTSPATSATRPRRTAK